MAREAAGNGGLLSGTAERRSPGTAAGETRAWAGQRLGSVAGAGRPRLGRSGCRLPDLRPQHPPPAPNFLAPGAGSVQGKRVGGVGSRGCLGLYFPASIFLVVRSLFPSPEDPFCLPHTPEGPTRKLQGPGLSTQGCEGAGF